MGRLDFQVDRYAYNPEESRLNRFRNPYKPPDVLGVSREKFSDSSVSKDTYFTHLRKSMSSAEKQASRSSSLPGTSKSSVAGADLSLSLKSFHNPPDSQRGSANVMIYNESKSIFEEAIKRPQGRARISTLTPPRGVEPVLPESREAFKHSEKSRRPKPTLSSHTSNFERANGIEFKESETLEKYVLGVGSSQRPSRRSSPKKTSIQTFPGIGEKESEYKHRFDGKIEGFEGRPKPNWYTWDEVRSPFGVD